MLNRYPLWKNLLIFGVLLISTILALPNLYGEDPSVQVPATRDTVIDEPLKARVEHVLTTNNLDPKRIDFAQEQQLLVRFNNTEDQLKAKDLIAKELKKEYVTALNLAPDMPDWRAKLGLQPKYLGLDLRGGVQFLLEIDMDGLISQLAESYADNIRTSLENEQRSFKAVSLNDDDTITISFENDIAMNQAFQFLTKQGAYQELRFSSEGNNLKVVMGDNEINTIRKNTVTQNIRTLRNRVNELGVAEPVIQQQGPNRIVVQLPGVQDTARA